MVSIKTVGELLAYLSDKPMDMPVNMKDEQIDPGCGCCSTGEVEVTYYPLEPRIIDDTIEF